MIAYDRGMARLFMVCVGGFLATGARYGLSGFPVGAVTGSQEAVS